MQFEDSDDGITNFCSVLKNSKRQLTIAMEGTGGYEYLLLKHLASHQLEAAVLHEIA